MENYTIHPSAVVDPGCAIGEGTRIWHFSHLMTGCTVGAHCSIGQNVVISPGVRIGNGVKIQNNVSVYTGVTCEDDVFLGPSCVFTNVLNPRSAISRKDQFRETRVERGASIGANATIVCGHTIGRYALIGAGAVCMMMSLFMYIDEFRVLMGRAKRPARRKMPERVRREA